MTQPLVLIAHASGWFRATLLVGVFGAATCIVGFVVEPSAAYASYLAAYMAVLSVVLGALILVMVSHATGAKWFVLLRRLAETCAVTLPVLVVLFVPILFGLRHLYMWMPPLVGLDAELRRQILAKQPYLNAPFFVARAIVYFVVWIAVAEFLRRWSVRQDASHDPRLTVAQRRLSAGGLVAVAVTLTFASFDWLMSLSPAWYSTIYGVYVFAGGFLAALALVSVLAVVAHANGRLTDTDIPEHLHALGKLLLTFVIFWAYIAFAQLLIIWIGGIPVEISWYATRLRGSWGALGIALAVGQFGIPFVLLLFRRLKRSPWGMAALGVWLLVMHLVDVYWMAVPSLVPHGFSPRVWDIAAIAAVVGLAFAYGMWRQRSVADAPIGDPYYDHSLAYRTAV